MLHYGFRHNSEAMIHMGLSLLTVALESGSHHIGTFPSLMNYVKDDMCKNLFWVGILWKLKILIEANIGLDKGKGSNIIKQQKNSVNSVICIHWSMRKPLLVRCCIVVWQYCSVSFLLWWGSTELFIDCTCVNTKKLLSYKQTHLCHSC